ncbi:hypothetical protein GQ457_12G014440 [Hibiscus cannabinus]
MVRIGFYYTLPADLFLLLLVLLWNIWNSRNDFVHNSHFQPPWLLVLNSETLLRDYLCHNSVIPPPTNHYNPHWTPPHATYTKINIDGAFDPTTHAAGIGVITRDHLGSVLGGLAQHSANCLDVLHAEFSAIVADLYLARDFGWRKIQIESDSAILINKFNRTGLDLSVLSSQVSNARELLCHFDGCIFLLLLSVVILLRTP